LNEYVEQIGDNDNNEYPFITADSDLVELSVSIVSVPPSARYDPSVSVSAELRVPVSLKFNEL
jgi:hypothetical protein